MKEFIWVSIITWTLDGRWQLLDVYRGWPLGIMAECPRGHMGGHRNGPR